MIVLGMGRNEGWSWEAFRYFRQSYYCGIAATVAIFVNQSLHSLSISPDENRIIQGIAIGLSFGILIGALATVGFLLFPIFIYVVADNLLELIFTSGLSFDGIGYGVYQDTMFAASIGFAGSMFTAIEIAFLFARKRLNVGFYSRNYLWIVSLSISIPIILQLDNLVNAAAQYVGRGG